MNKVLITGTGSELQGVGRLEDGRAVFVPMALPGETAEIEITREKDRFAQARLVSTENPSPRRTQPVCPYYGSCGGCRAQHMEYGLSLSLKREKVQNALTHIGGLTEPLVEETLPSEKILAYRNKAEFACVNGCTGVFEEGTNRVIDTDACLLQADSVNRLLVWLKKNMGNLPIKYIVTRINDAGEIMLTLSLTYPGDITELARRVCAAFEEVRSVYLCRLNRLPAHALDGECVKVLGEDTLFERLCGLSFTVSPRSFFQVNRPQAEKLYETALRMAELKSTDKIADIYCGAGTISLCAARACAHVTGIEIVPEAIRDAKRNAERNGLTKKTEFLCGDAARVYPALAAKNRFDAVIVDPPRKGLDKAVTDALIAVPAEKLVYVSCDPGTLARDVKLLTQSGRYRFVSAQPVDMFPLTAHVETVVLLSKLHEAKHHVSVKLDMDEMDLTSAESKATYEEIKKYVAEHNEGMKVSSLNIAQVKRKCGIELAENYNLPKSEDSKQPLCPKEKEDAIVEALKAFQMI